jgi:hypothetical protein
MVRAERQPFHLGGPELQYIVSGGSSQPRLFRYAILEQFSAFRIALEVIPD